MNEIASEPSHSPTIELKKLSPKHMQVAALVAQGVDRRTIAEACGYTPEYITWLQGQPLFFEYIKTMNKAVAARLEALFTKSVDVIEQAMEHGNVDESLKGAKLQLEATGRIGRYQTQTPVAGGEDRLLALSERLVELLRSQRRIANGEVVEGEVIREDSKGKERSSGEVSGLQPNPG